MKNLNEKKEVSGYVVKNIIMDNTTGNLLDDHDALVELISFICTDNDTAAAESLLMSWRRQEYAYQKRLKERLPIE